MAPEERVEAQTSKDAEKDALAAEEITGGEPGAGILTEWMPGGGKHRCLASATNLV
jgi:hypothetical protein